MLHTQTASPSLPMHLSHPRPLVAALDADLSDIELLRRAFSPAVLGDEVLQQLSSSARLVRCPAGPFEVASPRRPEPSWWLVARGRLALGSRSGQAPFVETRCIGPGEWLETAGAMTAPGTWLEQAECRTPVELLAVPLAAMNEACASCPSFPSAYASVLARRVRELSDQLHDLASADVTGRVARWLLRQTPASERDGTLTVVLTERKQAIARQLGTTSESLSRSFRRLTNDGLVEVNGYQVVLRDPAGLARQAGVQAGV